MRADPFRSHQAHPAKRCKVAPICAGQAVAGAASTRCTRSRIAAVMTIAACDKVRRSAVSSLEILLSKPKHCVLRRFRRNHALLLRIGA
jgi:hypothetical protein